MALLNITISSWQNNGIKSIVKLNMDKFENQRLISVFQQRVLKKY